MKKGYNFAVWGTQGGGLVREVNGKFVFVEPPSNFPEFNVGSEKPFDWDIIPANEFARQDL